MLSYITPPVALGAYAAASIAEAKPLETGLSAMRLGSIIYLVPFIFVLDVTFLMQGAWSDIALGLVECLIGIWLVVGALQGFLTGYGAVNSPVARTLMAIGGLCIAMPDLSLIVDQPPSNFTVALVGTAIAVVAVGLAFFGSKSSEPDPSTGEG